MPSSRIIREYPAPADKSATGIPLANGVRISSDGSPIAPDDHQEYICATPSGGISVPEEVGLAVVAAVRYLKKITKMKACNIM